MLRIYEKTPSPVFENTPMLDGAGLLVAWRKSALNQQSAVTKVGQRLKRKSRESLRPERQDRPAKARLLGLQNLYERCDE
jgi:hypothetical protein